MNRRHVTVQHHSNSAKVPSFHGCASYPPQSRRGRREVAYTPNSFVDREDVSGRSRLSTSATLQPSSCSPNAAPAPTQPPPTTTTSKGASCLSRSTWPFYRYAIQGAASGARTNWRRKEGAAGSVIVASARLDGRMQRRASNAAAAAIFSSHRLGSSSLCCAQLWMKLLR